MARTTWYRLLRVPGEPRRAVPHAVVEAIIDMVEARYLHDFFAVQMVFLILVLYYSFSRTECPCPMFASQTRSDALERLL